MKSSALGSIERACQQVLIANLMQVSVCQQPSEKFCQASQCTAASITEKETKHQAQNYHPQIMTDHYIFGHICCFVTLGDLKRVEISTHRPYTVGK